MARRQEAKDPRDERIAQLEHQVSMLQTGITETNRLITQMVTQLGALSVGVSPNNVSPWKEAFGNRYDAIVTTLKKNIPFEAVSSIMYKGGERIPYVTGYYVYSAMNALFGPDQWSYTVTTSRTGSALYNATVTINVAGVSRTNGSASKPAKGNAPEQLAMKAAITNAFKRAAANFGNILGLCLYNQAYVREFSKAKSTKQIPIDEDKVIHMIYNSSHPEGISEIPLVKKRNKEVLVKEGVTEDSITDLKDPENVDESIKTVTGPVPVVFSDDRTNEGGFVTKEGSITYSVEEKDNLKRKNPSVQNETDLDIDDDILALYAN